MNTPPFLTALGLPGDADERAVRRAYARQLKQIDQAQDPEGFQRLRQAYEFALLHVQSRTPQAPQESTGEPPDPPPREVPLAASPAAEPAMGSMAPDMDGFAVRTGEEVFDDFLKRLPPLPRPMWNSDSAKGALSNALNDPRLVNLQARMVFEGSMALYLVRGWRPGHEDLLVAAIEVFEWENDRYRLTEFGRVGAVLEAAMTERALFLSHSPGWQDAQRELVSLLRYGEARPFPTFLADKLGPLRQLAASFPHWLAMLGPVQRLAEWEQLARAGAPPDTSAQAPRPKPVLPQRPPEPRRISAPKSGGLADKLVVVLAIVIVSLFVAVSHNGPTAPQSPGKEPTKSDLLGPTNPYVRHPNGSTAK